MASPPLEVGPEPRVITAEELRRWLLDRVSQHTGIPAGDLDPDANFTSFGLDSLVLAGLCHDMGHLIGREIPEDIIWEHPSTNALIAHVTGRS